MNKPVSKNTMWLGWPVAALVVATAFPATAFGAERCVLGEYFNATW